MLKTAFLAVLFVGVIGLAFKIVLARMELTNYYGKYLRITASEFVIALVAVSFIIVPSVWAIGKNMSVSSQLEHEEFYGGVELKPEEHPTTCRDGHSGNDANDGKSNCRFTYDSGKDYTYLETYYVQVCNTNSKGNTSCHSEPRIRSRSATIYYPYATHEYHYSIPDTLGRTFEFPDTYLAEQPERAHSKDIPAKYPRGAPSDWKEAKTRFDQGDPRSVEGLFPYDSPILATNDKFLTANAGNVKKYRDAKLLTDHTVNILKNPLYGPTNRQAKKVAFVDVTVANPEEWQNALSRFNAACGMKLQCDLHVVIVNSNKVPRADAGQYVQALKAYWQSDRFKKRAISKNVIMLGIGTSDGKTVDWSNATTGMPYGNNIMLESLASSLPGLKLEPNVILGSPRTVATPYKDKKGKTKFNVNVTHTTPLGAVEAAVFNDGHGFKRACMLKCEKGEIGFGDLIEKIEPSAGAKAWMIFIICFLSLFFWSTVAATSFAEFGEKYLKALFYPRKNSN